MNVTTKGGTFSMEEIEGYKEYLAQKFPNSNITELHLEVDEEDPEFVKMTYTLENKPEANVPFNRIRRITGYLVGNLTRWNDGKLAEERDRVKHGITEFTK